MNSKFIAPIILVSLVLIMGLAKKKLEMSDEVFNQVMGFLVGVLSQQTVTQVKRARADKKVGLIDKTPDIK